MIHYAIKMDPTALTQNYYNTQILSQSQMRTKTKRELTQKC